MDQDDDTGIVLTEEQKRRRRARSIAIAFALGALVLLWHYAGALLRRVQAASPS